MAHSNFRKISLLALGAVSILLLGLFVLEKSLTGLQCANSLSCEESLEFSVDNDEEGVYNGVAVEPPDIELSNVTEAPPVLGSEEVKGEKRIEVDLTTQTLRAYEGDELFMEARVSTGKLFPTPTGEFTIWRKIRSTKMSGGTGSGYYYLPNVPFVMFFSNSQIAAGRGFSLHGTYWHNNFGHPMSHGCVNMRTMDVKKLYEWADPQTSPEAKQSLPGETGTKIVIYGKAP